MNLAEVLLRRIKKNAARIFTEEQGEYITYADLLEKIKVVSAKFRSLSSDNIVLRCEKGINMAIAVLSGLYSDKKVIPINRNLNEEQVNSIAEQLYDYCYIADEDIEQALNATVEDIRLPVAMFVPIILFTSGTTGRFKGVRLTQNGLLFNIKRIAKVVRYSTKDRMLICRSLAHVAALVGDLLVGVFSGVSFVFYDGCFSPLEIRNEILKRKITLWNCTPTCMFSCAALRMDIQINKCVLSGEVLAESVYARIRQSMPDTVFYAGYGMTEAGPRISMGKIPKKIRTGYAGKLLRGVKARIVDDEIQINSPAMAHVYIGEKNSWGLWFHTHDRGYIMKKKIYVIGRTDNLIVRGGVNIDPSMIEDAIQSDLNIANCKVYAKSDVIMGQKICAVVQPIREGIVTESYVLELCRKKLPKFMWCNEVEITEKINIGVTGKK